MHAAVSSTRKRMVISMSQFLGEHRNNAVPQQLVLLLLAVTVFLGHIGIASAQDPNVYNFPIGYTQCYSCQAGSYVEEEGSGQCKACGPGYYQDVNGSTSCKPCPEGEAVIFEWPKHSYNVTRVLQALS